MYLLPHSVQKGIVRALWGESVRMGWIVLVRFHFRVGDRGEWGGGGGIEGAKEDCCRRGVACLLFHIALNSVFIVVKAGAGSGGGGWGGAGIDGCPACLRLLHILWLG